MYLITGVPRSGTTPLGYIFEKYLNRSILHEPFNYNTGITQVDSYFEFAATRQFFDETKLNALLVRLQNKTVLFKYGIFSKDSFLKILAKCIIGSKSYRSYKAFEPERGVIKDPFLCLSLEYVENNFDHIFITIHNPDGIASSFCRLSWIFPETYPRNEILESFGLQNEKNLEICPEFYAVYLQYCFYQQLEKVYENKNVTIVDMASLMHADIATLKSYFSVVDLRSWNDFHKNIQLFYKGKTFSLSKLGFHNHHKGKKILKTRGEGFQRNARFEVLYNYIDEQYKRFSHMNIV